MANNCEYELRIKGSEKALELFGKTITYGGTGNKSEQWCKTHKWFYRIFSADKICEGDNTQQWYGDCAWSVASSFQKIIDDKMHITLSDFCEENKCECEVWSEEPGCCFAEHIHILSDGTLDVDDCFNFWEFEFV